MNGGQYDVYTPKSTNADRIIGAMAKKNSQAHGIVIDLSQTSVKASVLSNVLKRMQRAGGKNIKDLVIIGGE